MLNNKKKTQAKGKVKERDWAGDYVNLQFYWSVQKRVGAYQTVSNN